MFIAHIPAGYAVSKLFFPYFKSPKSKLGPFLWAGVLGAYAPDFDMLYFHLIDHRQHHHHTYWVHYPFVWGSILLISAIVLFAFRGRNRALLAFIFALNGFIHLLLDSIVGDIWWFAPLIDRPFAFFTVPALYKPWWLNFLFHWSFVLELAIVVFAVNLWLRGPALSLRRGARQNPIAGQP